MNRNPYNPNQYDNRPGAPNITKKVKIITLAVTLFMILFIVIVPSLVIVQTGELAVVRRLGLANEVLPPGMHLRIWMINRIDRYDVTVRPVNLEFSAYSIDAQNVRGAVTIQYQLNPGQIIATAEQFGQLAMLEGRLHSVMMQETQNVVALKSAMEIVETRAFLSQEIQARLNRVAPEFNITITAVAVERIVFSPAFEQAVEQRMISEQAMMQAEFERDRVIVLAEQQREVAAIEAEATLLKAAADAEALRIMQDAWGDLGAEVRDAMLRQMFFEQWNGILPQVLGGDNLGLIMDGLGER